MRSLTRRDFLRNSFAAASTIAAAPSSELANAVSLTNHAAPLPASGSSPVIRERLLLDFGWRFHFGHASEPPRDFGFKTGDEFTVSGAMFAPSRESFDDSDWRTVDLPHDWVVELGIEESKVRANLFHGFRPVGWASPETSIGWYRRVFVIPESDRGKRVSIEFDGVFRDSLAVLNGHFLGRHMSGYSGFSYDITDFANYGGKNVVVVRADATGAEGWWYEGGGIYRHVWLVKTQPVHLAPYGIFVTSAPQRDGRASVYIASDVENQSDRDASCRVRSTIVDASGKEVAVVLATPFSVPSWGSHKFKQQVHIPRPELWSIESPHLYRLVTTVESGGNPVDRCETKFGVRTIGFDPNNGFSLNGKQVKIKGTCNHQDHAGVGIALPDRIQSYRIQKLKEMGANAYRTVHNHATPELLDACDSLGMLVLCEPRMVSSNQEGLRQLEALVLRDRNHPSVFAWSLGNQEPIEGTDRGVRIVSTMKRLVRRLDPSRPVTFAMDQFWGKGVSAVTDVQGFNYGRVEAIDEFRRQFPGKPTLGTEVASSTSTRGVYVTDAKEGYLSAYDTYEQNRPGWGCPPDTWWTIYSERPFLAGGFVWAGFDYRGEPKPPKWPSSSSQYGALDTCGFPKDSFYYYKAWWTEKPVLHIFPHWNWPGREGQEIEVYCYSNLDKVDLFLNGHSLGAKEMPRNSHLVWRVKYAPGSLEARGYKDGKEVLVEKRETTGKPARLVLRPDREHISADGEDVSLIEVRVEDKQGQLIPNADNEVAFQVSGAGKIIGVGNGNPSSHEPDKASKRKAFNGLCMVIVQSTKQAGQLRLVAESADLESATVVISCEKAELRPAVG
jgi:beta-galactosidase